MKDSSASLFALPTPAPDLLKARKRPQQARSVATVEAIFAATIQVLLAHGPGNLTTTRVAERAGVSVGTMYQYFPHKQALFFAVLQRHLALLTDAVESAHRALEGKPFAVMSDGLVAAFLEARTSDIDASRAIYLFAADLDTEALLSDVFDRVRSAVTRLLASASDATFDNLDAVAQMMCATLSGTTRTVLERSDPGALEALKRELPALCRAYLAATACPAGGHMLHCHSGGAVVPRHSAPA
jgi:AcrR family transcriptional regulator